MPDFITDQTLPDFQYGQNSHTFHVNVKDAARTHVYSGNSMGSCRAHLRHHAEKHGLDPLRDYTLTAPNR